MKVFQIIKIVNLKFIKKKKQIENLFLFHSIINSLRKVELGRPMMKVELSRYEVNVVLSQQVQ